LTDNSRLSCKPCFPSLASLLNHKRRGSVCIAVIALKRITLGHCSEPGGITRGGPRFSQPTYHPGPLSPLLSLHVPIRTARHSASLARNTSVQL
jgi:hypothetical protein